MALNKIKVYRKRGGFPYNRTQIGKGIKGAFEFNTVEVEQKISSTLDEAEMWEFVSKLVQQILKIVTKASGFLFR
ncbi:hypothetical protein QUF88_04570 [Bacillus sp. DX1.1]|uniref:hypothetical protein n=1 Tax=unclassified Bacillus (in: firmicutes) TaxID=185979 RepID=UPI002570AB1C|nr:MULTISPECIES: hypothetical protein [unclassified Bacillus (in: firmicutes)]MDM5153165.1 hypothetical protein [Bacillus sp. DX1.1]WJE82133.1 hypothetical protein QRE67_02095 [Bacillus sp. DX3.1]